MSPVPRSTRDDLREVRRKAGRRGGLARDASRRRGSPDYYAALASKSAAARAARTAEQKEPTK